jgi:hypothetical protein
MPIRFFCAVSEMRQFPSRNVSEHDERERAASLVQHARALPKPGLSDLTHHQHRLTSIAVLSTESHCGTRGLQLGFHRAHGACGAALMPIYELIKAHAYAPSDPTVPGFG